MIAATPTARTYGDYELKQLVGRRRNGRTGRIETVRTDMDEVYHCGQRIGYLCRRPNTPFCPLGKLDPDFTQQTLDALKAIRAQDGCFGVPSMEPVAFPSAVTPELIESFERQERVNREEDEEEADDE
jgi:hypothetical protein